MRLRCPVCGAPLVLGEKVYACPQGHSFDVARQGYCNLLPVTKKHSKSPGDTKEQVQARRAFLSGGFYRPIADMLCRLAVPLKPNTRGGRRLRRGILFKYPPRSPPPGRE